MTPRSRIPRLSLNRGSLRASYDARDAASEYAQLAAALRGLSKAAVRLARALERRD
jgi:hypothetical protein